MNYLEKVHMNYLVQDVFVQVGHVTLAGHRTVIVVPEMVLQRHRVVRDAQDRAQVVGEHLDRDTSLMIL